MQRGDHVIIHSPSRAACSWWHDGATGTVQRIFRNGKVAVALHDIRNQSADGRLTQHFDPRRGDRLTVIHRLEAWRI